jgi:hypothetical protein
MGFIDKIRLQVKKNLEVSKIRILRQVKNRLLFVHFAFVVVHFVVIVFIVVNIHKTLSDEEHFFDIGLVTDNNLAWDVDSTEHIDD